MRRLHVGLMSLMVVLLMTFAVPVQAQDDDEFVLQLAPLNSVRYDFIYTLNGVPLQVCQAEWESANRGHTTCQDLVSIPELELIEGYVRETVIYEDTIYIRDNEETIWLATENPSFNPNISLTEALFGIGFESAVTELGTVTISGIPTTHYQFWSLDEELNDFQGGQVVYDIFVSNESLVVQDQISVRASIEDEDDAEFTRVWGYSNFNAPISVSPPPAELVQPASVGPDSSYMFSLRPGMQR
ncbi:MAG: hypothetical protein ACLFVO_11930 [Chloroflexaceae bacterium]